MTRVLTLATQASDRNVHFQNWLGAFDAYNFLQLFPETGTWNSGTWQMYGKRKIN